MLPLPRYLFLAALVAGGAIGLRATEDAVTVSVFPDEIVGELRPIWNYYGYDEALTTLTPEGQHLLAELNALTAQPIRVRVHHLLTSGDGTLALKWSSTNVYT